MFLVHHPGMAYMMDYRWGGDHGYGRGFPFYGWGMMLIWLVVSLAIASLVYQDANTWGMNGASVMTSEHNRPISCQPDPAVPASRT